MKEIKVYVDELPESCNECPCECDYHCGVLNCDVIDQICNDTKYKDCPLIDIKDHDRELVKEVCEKIGKWGNKHFNYVGDGTGYDGQDYNEMIGFNNAIMQLNEFLAQIQRNLDNE